MCSFRKISILVFIQRHFFAIIISAVMDADPAPHPFTSLMPDSVEQSRDANERVCLPQGLGLQ